MAKPRLKKHQETKEPANLQKSEKSHTDLSPSNAERWLNCPGSVALCASCPRPEQSEHAAEGEAAHKLLERTLKEGIDPYSQIGTMIGEFPVTDEMADAVVYARDIILADLQKGGELLTEQRLEIFPGIKGTLDAAVIREFDSISVYDFKYGKGHIVRAADNPQLLLYIVGLLRQHDVQRFKLTIIQPRTEGMMSTWECDSSYMVTFTLEVVRRIRLTQEKDAPVAAGTWCRWCWAKAVCPAVRQDIADQLPALPGKELIFPDVKGLSVDVVKRVLDVRDMIDSWMDAVFAYAKEYIEAGGTIEGWDLARKRCNRKWKDEAEALKALSDLGDKAFKVALLSPAQMEKVAGKERVAALTIVPEGEMTLKRTDSKEPVRKETK